MPLFPQDVAFIKDLIRQEYFSLQKQQKTTPEKEYHTVDDLRKIILEHLEEIRELVGTEEFPIATIRAFLKRRITLKPGDLDLVHRNGGETCRIDGQVTNVFNYSVNWPEKPFVFVRRGHYRLRPVATQLKI